jgi:hypothetical protein
MFMFADKSKAESFESPDDALFGGVGWKSRHYVVISPSAINASNTGESSRKALLPNVAI